MGIVDHALATTQPNMSSDHERERSPGEAKLFR